MRDLRLDEARFLELLVEADVALLIREAGGDPVAALRTLVREQDGALDDGRRVDLLCVQLHGACDADTDSMSGDMVVESDRGLTVTGELAEAVLGPAEFAGVNLEPPPPTLRLVGGGA